jgi:hypothetical protein
MTKLITENVSLLPPDYNQSKQIYVRFSNTSEVVATLRHTPILFLSLGF